MTDSLPARSVKSRLVTGFAWTMTSRIAVNIIGFASSIILARLLMPEDFGIVALATSLVAIVMALTTLPIADALIQTTNVEDDHIHSAFTLGLARSLLLALLLALAAWPAAQLYGDDRLIGIMLVLAASAACTGFFSPRWPLIQKELSFGPTFVMATASRLTGVAVAIPIAYVYRSMWSLVIAMALTQILSVLITHYYVPYRPRLNTKRIKDIWSFSVWVTFSSILNTINARLDTLLVGAMMGQRTVGYYSYGDDKAAMPTRELSGPMVAVLFPGLAAVKDEPGRMADAYRRVQSLLFALCVPAGIGLALVADQFVHVLLGDKWLPTVPIIQILSAALSLEMLIVAAAPLAMAQGRTRALFHRDIINFACRMPAILIGLWFFGLSGVLIARALTTVTSVWFYMRLVKSIAGIGVRDQLLGCARSFGALAVMIAGVLLFKASPVAHSLPAGLDLLTTIALGGALYVGGHALIWLLAGRPHGPEAEIVAILGSVKRRRARRPDATDGSQPN